MIKWEKVKENIMFAIMIFAGLLFFLIYFTALWLDI